MKRSLFLLFAFLFIAGFPVYTSLAATTIEETEAMIAEADSSDAAILSPKMFGKAKDALNDAKTAISKKKSDEKIQDLLKKAQDFAKKAGETAEIGHKVLKDALPARAKAVAVDASNAAKKQWDVANSEWKDVISDLEDNSIESARKYEKDLIEKFGKAEVEAIKNTVLKNARDAIDAAKKMGAETYAPLTLRTSTDAEKNAESELNQSVYAGDKAKESARIATMEAKHAQKITEVAKRFSGDESGWEKGFLGYEEYLNGFARRLNLDLEWSDGPEGAAKQVLQAIDSVHLASESQLSLKDQQYAFLQQNFQKTRTKLEDDLSKAQLRVAELESRLGIAQRESDELKRHKELEEMTSKLADQFGPKEASTKLVDPKGTILLRLVGLTFASGSSTINASMEKILAKAITGIQELPNPSLVVAGHTDSQGDETRNKKLSSDRASAVASYLQSNLGLPESRITVEGHGSEQPIADNDTREGRMQNRRIDILIKVSPK